MSRGRQAAERSAKEVGPDREGSILALHVVFVLVGMATALPGAILPALATHWSLHDARAGLLFAAQFAGGSTGGLLTRKKFFWTTTIGLGLLAASALGLSVAGATMAIPLLFLYGVGHGSATTAVNIAVGRRYENRRGAALSFLNFSWSLGAAVCPLLMAQLLKGWEVGWAFEAMSLLAIGGLVFLLVTSRREVETRTTNPVKPLKSTVPLIAFFALMAFLYVGVESTIGGWISTWAERAAVLDMRHATAMASYFWSALLVGRALSALVLRRVSEVALFTGSLVTAAAGIALLIGSHSSVLVAVAAVITGLSLAPLFPLNLSLFLARTGEFSRAGIVLALSGFGGALLPWLTGILSSREGSLRIGLGVPLAATLAMLLMALFAKAGSKPIYAREH